MIERPLTVPAALLHRLGCLPLPCPGYSVGDCIILDVCETGGDLALDEALLWNTEEGFEEGAYISTVGALLTPDTQTAICRCLAMRYGDDGEAAAYWLRFDHEGGVWELCCSWHGIPVAEWDTLERAPQSDIVTELFGGPAPYAPWLEGITNRTEALLAILTHLDSEVTP